MLLVSGSTRAASTNTAALRTLRDVAPTGLTATLYDGLAELPAFNPDHEDRAGAAVERLRRELAEADGVVFCTPEYAGSLPGSFKNLLDWTVGGGELYGKPVAWVTVAPPGRGEGAEATLATVLGYVGARIVEEACVRLTVRREAIGPEGKVVDDAVRAGLAEMVRTFTEQLAASAAG